MCSVPDALDDSHQLARAEEGRAAAGTAALVEACRHNEPGCEHYVTEPIGGGWMCCASPGDWCNQAVGLGLDGPVGEDDLDRLVAFFVSRGIEPRIEVAAVADESLLAGLAARGFHLAEFENVLARRIDPNLPIESVRRLPAEVRIDRVDPTDTDATRKLADVSDSGFRPDDQAPSPFAEQTGRQLIRLPECDGYLARADGVAVGGSTMESRDGLAALFGTSVLPPFRRRGIQTALIAARLERARQRECTLATIHSRPGIPTERNARRMGFALAYAKGIMTMPGDGLVASI